MQRAADIGYPTLEQVLEEPKPDFSGMLQNHDILRQLAITAGTAKEKAAAKQAAVAYEHFFELMHNLLELREKMLKDHQAQGKSKKK